MSAVYPKFREQVGTWLLDGSTPAGITWWVVGVSAAYAYDAAHVELAQVSGASILIAEAPLTGVTAVNGIFRAADMTLDTPTQNVQLDAIIVYMRWAGGNRLACYLDSSPDGTIPATLASVKGVLRWNPNGIFVI